MSRPSGDVIHHLVPSSDWPGEPSPTYEPPGFAAEGFIHFSTTEQVPATSLRHYAQVADLLLVTVAVEALDADLRWEDLSGTGVFPHLYGALNIDAVRSVVPYRAGEAVPIPTG